MAMPGVAEFDQRVWSGGICQALERHLIPRDSAWDITDGLLDDDGAIYTRGAVEKLSDAEQGDGLLAVWEAGFAHGRRTLLAPEDGGLYVLDGVTPTRLSDFPVPPFATPTPMVAAPGAQFGDVLWIVHSNGVVQGYAGSLKAAGPYNPPNPVDVTQGSPVVTTVAGGLLANVDAGMFVGLGGQAYVVKSVDSDDAFTLTEPYADADGTPGAQFSSLETLSGASFAGSARCVVAVADRLCVAVGRRLYVGPGRDPNTGRLTYYVTTGSNEWDHNSYIEFPGEIVAAAALRDRAVVFTTAGAFMVSGLAYDVADTFGNPNWRPERVSGELVARSAGSVAAWHDRLLVAATDGVHLMDVQGGLERLSTSIGPLWRSHVLASDAVGMIGVFADHVFVPVDDFVYVARLDRRVKTPLGPSAPWTRLHVGDLAAIVAIVGADPNGAPKLLAGSSDSGWVLDCTGIFRTSVLGAGAQDAVSGETVSAVIETREFEPADGALIFVRDVVLDYLLGAGAIEVGWERDGGSSSGTAVTQPGVNAATEKPRAVGIGKSVRRIALALTFEGAAPGSKLRRLTFRARPRGRRR